MYTVQYRCFFELLQNADDCVFGEHTTPSIMIQLFPEGVVVSNNELHGFSAADVASLCEVGASTKPAQQHAATGKKGIGFKSVFSLSDTPMVFSGPFQIQFDANELGGEITPSWVEAAPAFATLPSGLTDVVSFV